MGLVRSSGWMPIAGWCAATATSIVLASVALTPVLRTATPQDQALAQLPAKPAEPSAFPVPLPTVTTPGAAPTPSRTRPDKATKKPAAKPATTTEDGWTVTTAAGGVRTYVRSFRVEGGQAVIKMTSDGAVHLVTATPADGYAVQKVQDSPGNMAVYFNETAHSFIIHATWWDDHPFAEVSEVGS
jgi:hypothetical protein